MHVCGANCHAQKKDLAETGILMELQLLNKSCNPNNSFPMWDMVMWGKLKSEPNLDCYLNSVMDDVVYKRKRTLLSFGIKNNRWQDCIFATILF